MSSVRRSGQMGGAGPPAGAADSFIVVYHVYKSQARLANAGTPISQKVWIPSKTRVGVTASPACEPHPTVGRAKRLSHLRASHSVSLTLAPSLALGVPRGIGVPADREGGAAGARAQGGAHAGQHHYWQQHSGHDEDGGGGSGGAEGADGA
eukprot:5877420-Pyramimonas_sp.AAC.2